jgi:hypothetical protein
MPTVNYKGASLVLGGPSGVPYLADTEVTTPTNTNAPPPRTYVTSSGTVTFTWPAIADGYTFVRVQLMSAAATPTSKTVGGIAGWLTGSITLPAAPGGTLAVINTSIEEIVAVFS